MVLTDFENFEIYLWALNEFKVIKCKGKSAFISLKYWLENSIPEPISDLKAMIEDDRHQFLRPYLQKVAELKEKSINDFYQLDILDDLDSYEKFLI